MNTRRTVNRFAIATIALSILLTLSLPALAEGPADALEWLKAQQNADGGFGSPESSVSATADVIIAAAAIDRNALVWSIQDGESTLTYLEANVVAVTKAGDTAKLIVGLTATEVNPRDVGGVDLVEKLEAMVGDEGRIGGEGEFLNEHAYSMIGLRAAQRPIPPEAVQYLLERQIEDGTWSWNGDMTDGSGDNNTAALAVMALIAAGVSPDHPQIQKTIEHFRTQQNADGGFPYIKPSPYGTDSDANSTAVVAWALKAAGEDPAGDEWKYQGQDGLSILDKLRSFQNEDGAFRWQDDEPADNFAATVQGLVAEALETLPLETMDVGGDAEDVGEDAEDVGGDAEDVVEGADAAEAATTDGATAETAEEEPVLLPETGANLWLQVMGLLGSGAALVGVGLLLRRRLQAVKVRHSPRPHAKR